MAFHVEAPTGRATLEALLALVARLDAVAAADPEAGILLDQTQFEYAGIGTDEVRTVGEAWQATAHASRARVAVVAPDSTVFGLSRQGVAYAEAESTIRVFRTRDEAEGWLGGGS